ncbi:MAG: bifunctional riboflavin kinase/FAD synthetase [Lachnospiraceae bacterium]|nr:bifunctional riboflavin kinase/FAD synthetase [Robinsoniella sp.]MDY3765854.1 bifunctional riboflavin kinase/FAD synthetase [Lachnospiraceae bacterium]
MEYIQGTTEFLIQENTAVTLGKFDGVHRGHQKLIHQVLDAKKNGLKSVVFTMNPGKKMLLLTEEEQREVLSRQKIDYVIRCPFIPQISHMSPEEFIERILVGQLHAKQIVVGTDFHFGYQRQGDCALLQRLQERYGYRVIVMEKEQQGDRDISSSYTREALDVGNMELVNGLLGYPFPVMGEVRHGRRIGRTLGMPTTNLIPPEEKLLPPNGVYVSGTVIGGKTYPGITNIGYKPTVGETAFRGVETYLFDFDQDLYGKKIEVQLYQYVRPEKKFHSLEELKERMKVDISLGKEYFS